MSSESDGDGSPRGWMLVDNRGRAEDSDDSASGSSSDFVDLGENCVQYHHVRRSSSISDVSAGNSPTSSSAISSSLPANFRAHAVGANAGPQSQSCTPPEDDDQSIVSGDLFGFTSSGEAAAQPQHDEAAGPNNYDNALPRLDASALGRIEDEQPSDLYKSSSTLTGSQSLPPLNSALNDPENFEDQEGYNDLGEGGPANFQPSSTSVKLSNEDAETVALDSVAALSDSISVDSIEVLSLPSDGGNFLGGEAQVMMSSILEAGRGGVEGIQDDSNLETVPALVSMPIALLERDETNPSPSPGKDADRSSPSEESDTSEFERIEPDVVPSVEEIQNQPSEDDEENKMDVAGARPTEETEAEDIQNFLFRPSRPLNSEETGSQDQDQDGLFRPLLHPVNLPPPINPNEPGPSSFHPWRAPSTFGIRPFPLDCLPEDSLDGHCHWSPSGSRFHGRLGLLRQHSSNSSEEGFELVPRSRRQDDDAASSVSSSSSDLSGFVNVRQRQGPPVSPSISSRHSNNDDMLDSVSNFTDLSEDSLPANMMIQSQKSGMRQYRHHRDEGLNTRLDWMVAMVLLVGLALGIGHFIGSTQEMAHQRSIHTGQVQRLRELQDDLVTCLDRSTGIDSRVMTEKTSPALQAVKLLEGLNIKMLKEVVDSSHLLEQKVGPDDHDVVKRTDSDVWSQFLEEAMLNKEDEAVDDSGATGKEKEAKTDGLLEPQVSTPQDSSDSNVEESKDLSRGLESTDFQEVIEVNGLAQDDKGSASMNQTDKTEIASSDEPVQRAAPVVSDDLEDGRVMKEVKDAKENLEVPLSENVIIEQVQPEDTSEEIQPDKEGIKVKAFADHSIDTKTPSDSSDQIPESPKSVDSGFPQEPSRSDPDEDSTVEILRRKMEMMEEKMNEVIKTAQQWRDMLEKSKRTNGDSKEDQSQASETNDQSRPEKDDTEDKGKDHLTGIAATLESLWPGLLQTERGMEFLQYINQTQAASGSNGHHQNETASWWEAFYREVAALKAWPGESEEMQVIMNNTQLFMAHLGKEMESMTGYLRNQSAKMVEENNITMEGLGEHATKAWTKLMNVTADVMDYNRMVLSAAGEHLADTLYVVENVSAEIISNQNLSMSSISNVAEQVWGTVKNYTANVKDKIMNSTSKSTADQSGSSDDKASEEESEENAGGGFGERLKSAWESVHSYSANFTSKQNLSISGLREQVKAAWGKVKNTSTQVLEDISASSLAGTLKDGAKKLSETFGTTLKSVKEKAKGFHRERGGRNCWKNKRHYQSEKGEQGQRWKEEKHNKNHQHHQKHEEHSGKGNKDETSHKRWHSQHKAHHQGDEKSKGENNEPRVNESQHSVPSRKHHQGHQRDNKEKFHSQKESKDGFHSKQEEGYLYSAPGRLGRKQPARNTETVPEKSSKHHKQNHQHQQENQHSVPSGYQTEEPVRSNDVKITHDKEKMIPREHLKESHKRCPPHQARSGSKENQETTVDSNWEDLFDCVDMHCKGDEECMHSQRRDAAKLYAELLDYQEWLKDRNLRKDVKELKEFLEELGEFLSETDSSDRDLDELKDEFGEMVQDMEDGARKRERKRNKMQSKKHLHSQPNQESTAYVNEPDEMEENSTIIIDLKTLPQQQEQESDQFMSASQSVPSPKEGERRKYAGRGYHSSSDDDGDWYQQRAKDRAEQRMDHHWPKDRNARDTPNWYLHWVQGRINGRTGVTVWDMYEWIKERYIVREALRSHEMEDHTNWFLRRP